MTPLTVLQGLVVLAYYLALFVLFLYGINCYVLVCLYRRGRGAALAQDEEVWRRWRPDPARLPVVTVQLPLYNERYVVDRLLEAVTRLDYPRDRLEIQILDDSTDATRAIAARLAARYRREGFDIVHLCRDDRSGFKAGALKAGLEVAKGEFIAIFDADSVPAPDFLLKTLPFFEDPEVGMVQTRWGHINHDYSLLTRAQALAMDGHFGIEQPARAWSGFFLNFNGTAGVWRRAAIEDAGGWHTDTLTEDLDLSYRAQLKGWRLKYLPQVVCPCELPVQMSAFTSQQQRWAKGSIQTAKKLLPAILRARVPLAVKWQATLHLTAYLMHPAMLLVAVVSPLFLWSDGLHSGRDRFVWLAAFFSMATFGPSALFLYAQRLLYADWRRRILFFPTLFVFGTGVALSNTKAIVEALLNVRGAFVRTPKFRIEKPSDTWLGKRYRPRFRWFSLLEAVFALYCAGGVVAFLDRGSFDPFLGLYAVGFGSVALLSLREALWLPLLSRERGGARPADVQEGGAAVAG
ncbi:MAG TPA: cellulose synthase family protein [Thermodesulfobacteriota bacterium]|nr:cellulose synthase family protein [Thermodesulfobacteriota bacterium]